MCAFAIEKSKGVFLAAAAAPFNSHCPSRRYQKTRVSGTPGSERSNQSQEFYMFARNGDKARFNRERKQKIARCTSQQREILKGDHRSQLAE